ncbi:DNA polymerase III, epsilon subunit [Bellilinea caldifistulae]|nr:3'-5' exonuclease [Bellilinea caldifistulae]GAP09559.1 DNA polymerase III, epsilon subunit [Bellilinea caldifistulae]
MNNQSLSDIRAEMPAYISVDVETAGPTPDQFALLSIGACTVVQPRQTFYVELRPDRDAVDPQAAAVHGLSMETLRQNGLPPEQALLKFETWVHQVVPPSHKPIFLAFNAPFDWMFVHTYFIRYLGRNPFGHKALDIKAFYMGLSGQPWEKTSGSHLHRLFRQADGLTHNALQDALDQAVLFENMLAMLERDQSNPVSAKE